MDDSELEKTAILLRRLIHIAIRQELAQVELQPKPETRSVPGRVVRAKLPAEVAKDRQTKLSQALGLDRQAGG